jgi:hypothetical protein
MTDDVAGLRCLAASGQLGYGIPEDAYQRGLAREPAFIGADMGSIDPGPYCLGSGKMVVAGQSLRHDLELVVRGAYDLGVPLLIGSAGTAGAGSQLKIVADLIDSVLAELGISMPGAVIAADVPAELVARRQREGRVQRFGGSLDLPEGEAGRSTGLVAQMGVEPFQRALADGAQIVLAGRSCDTSMFAAIPLSLGYDPGPVMHMAKLIECTSGCADPGGRDASLGMLGSTDFVVESMDPAKRCTPVSVAAHSLYEQADPFHVGAPGGYLDLTGSHYEAVDDRTTRVSGSAWVPTPDYSVKLEGARPAGYRCIALCGIRDPRMITELDTVIDATRATVERVFAGRLPDDAYRLTFRRYGQDGTLALPSAARIAAPGEMLVLLDIVGADRETARSVAGVAKQYFLHLHYPDMLCTSGNCAIPFSPDVLEIGDVYEFNVYHLMELDDPLEIFPITYQDFGAAARKSA